MNVSKAILSLTEVVKYLLLSKKSDVHSADLLLLENLKEKLIIDAKITKKQTDIRIFF